MPPAYLDLKRRPVQIFYPYSLLGDPCLARSNNNAQTYQATCLFCRNLSASSIAKQLHPSLAFC